MRHVNLSLRHGFAGISFLLVSSSMAVALDGVALQLSPADPALSHQIRDASLVEQAVRDGRTDPADLFAAARADYGRILSTLYDAGYYGGTINILIDGTEAARLPPLDAPRAIGRITIVVKQGPAFRFETASIAPLPQGTILPGAFGRGELAQAVVIREAVDGAVAAWRDSGHAKVAIADQSLTADHATDRLSASVALNPGPLVHFGTMTQTSPSAVRAARIAKIADFPTGEVYSPQALDAVAERLRKTGAFATVALSEAEELGPGATLDTALQLVDAPRHRFGAGLELSSVEGLRLSGFWMARNLLGGAERLRIDAAINDIDLTFPGTDAEVAARLDIPAAFGRATGAYGTAKVEYVDDPAYFLRQGTIGLGLNRAFSETISGEIGLQYRYALSEDSFGTRRFSVLSVPASGLWDKRNDALDPTRGFYAEVAVEPFYVLGDAAFGTRAALDARAYRGFGLDDRFVAVARLQLGQVIGAGLVDVPPDYLFFSGGPDTVRGFPYQSLAIDAGGGDTRGGRAFLGLSSELRLRLGKKLGVVGFVDYGQLGAESLGDAQGGQQLGAGIGLRYFSGLGPLRLDLAAPIKGPGGDKVQVYIGIGQAF